MTAPAVYAAAAAVQAELAKEGISKSRRNQQQALEPLRFTPVVVGGVA
jgi:hypothetical protein